jgi:hypothetical protein
MPLALPSRVKGIPALEDGPQLPTCHRLRRARHAVGSAMRENSRADRAAIVEQLIERFAPANEEELTLAMLDGQLPNWVLLEERVGEAGEVLVLPVRDLGQIPRERLVGWAPFCILSLATGRGWQVTREGLASCSVEEALGW